MITGIVLQLPRHQVIVEVIKIYAVVFLKIYLTLMNRKESQYVRI